MIRRPPRSTRTDTSFPTRRSSDLVTALHQLPEQQLIGQRLLDMLLDHPAERAGAIELVVAALGQPGAGLVGQRDGDIAVGERSEEHTSELQSLMRISYAVFCLNKKK